ncbi:hypothetical protein UY3_05292 [Chelonia mydas]|uniref:Uncharacterized protein n=1 Tax=Chelonia mydas TaxID=8469 RepID=M7BP46_CHEMY|nr:hypothetical protein UY3_05292 [Chelonia mydas]
MLSEVLKEQCSSAETTEPKQPKKKINLLLVVSDSDDENENASVCTALDYYRAEPIMSMDTSSGMVVDTSREYESLAHLARKYLATLAARVPCKGLFSFSDDCKQEAGSIISCKCKETCLSEQLAEQEIGLSELVGSKVLHCFECSFCT